VLVVAPFDRNPPRRPVPLELTRSSAVPALLFALIFALFARHAGAATMAAATVVGAFGGALSLIVHELGHVRAARRVEGVEVRKVSLFALGAATHLEGAYRSGRDQTRVALAGPAASLVLAAPLMLALALPLPTPLKFASFLLSLLNVAIGLLSIVPVHPFDGHKLLVGLVWSAVGSESRARRTIRRIGQWAVCVDILGTLVLAARHPLLGAVAACAVAVFLCEKHLVRALPYFARRRSARTPALT
jgi:Zn-dependent protease